jgi:hypothetical protein
MRKGEPKARLTNDSARALLIGVIEQAVNDFKELAAAGRIVNGTVKPGQAVRGYNRDAEVQALLDFFNSDVIDQWIFLARIRLNPNLIREKLGLKHQDYDIYRPY